MECRPPGWLAELSQKLTLAPRDPRSPPQNAFGLQAPFFFFAAVCLVNLAFTGCCVPETKGRSLEQIESFFRTGRRSFLH